MIGKHVEWHVRGPRPATAEELARFSKSLQSTMREVQEGHSEDRLSSTANTRYANADHWRPSDEIRRGTVQFWNATEETVLVERDDGAWEQVPVVCIRSIECPLS